MPRYALSASDSASDATDYDNPDLQQVLSFRNPQRDQTLRADAGDDEGDEAEDESEAEGSQDPGSQDWSRSSRFAGVLDNPTPGVAFARAPFGRPTPGVAAPSSPSSFANEDPTAQHQLQLAMPGSTGSHAWEYLGAWSMPGTHTAVGRTQRSANPSVRKNAGG